MSNWEIKTETINDDYYWGEFGGFRVIVREEDGYINGTKLIGETGKRFNDWSRNKQTRELVKEVASSAGIPADDLMSVVTGGRLTELRGTYVHPDLVINLAQWCSPAYGVKVARIVQDYHAREHRRRERRLKKKMAAALEKAARAEGRWKEERAQVEKKEKKIDRLETTLAEIKALNTKNEREVARLLKMGTRQLDMLDHQDTQLTAISTKLDVARHDRILPTSKYRDRNTLIVMRLHRETRRSLYNYYVIRCKHQNAESSVARVIRDHPHATVAHQIEYSPNSMILWC